MDVMRMVLQESERAFGDYGPPTSTQEALGVLLEEFMELQEAIHANAPERIEHEAVQVAAVAVRLAQEIQRGNVAFFYRSGLNRSGAQPEAA